VATRMAGPPAWRTFLESSLHELSNVSPAGQSGTAFTGRSCSQPHLSGVRSYRTNEAKVLERGQQTSCESSQARSATIVHNVLPPLYSPTIPLGWGSMDGYWVVRPNPQTPADLH